jgi:group II intron reverse transcriptase/maturase
MHDQGKSDSPVIPAKPTNKTEKSAAEPVEGRGLPERNTASKTGAGYIAGQHRKNALDGVRHIAATEKETKFTALMHHISMDRLEVAYRAINPKAATGVDKVTWKEYGQNLEANLSDLHRRIQAGSYRPSPTRRVHIPKSNGKQRPLGVATLEDKIAQRATVEVLNAIYEEDFVGFSYGFREGRSPHDCLDALAAGIYKKKVNWVLDADIRAFYDTIDHEWLMKFLGHRIADKRMLRLIKKWLKAGVIEDGERSETTEGTPQGASASPLLANVYLHYVFDRWARRWRKQQANGDMIIVRFADDTVIGFEHERDARQFAEDIRVRFAEFALELADEKTRLIEFGRNAAGRRKARGLPRPETFDFLGFTHICGKTKKGRFMLRRITSKKRMRTKLQSVKDELKKRRHLSIPEQGKYLGAVVRGHLNYYAVPGNSDAISSFRHQATRYWHRSLMRRSQRHCLNWNRMNRIATRWIPPARCKHSFPIARFDARTQRRSPVR